MQALCEWDVQRSESAQAVLELFASLDAPNEAIGHGIELVEAFWRQRASVDGHISLAATKWDLDRISPVERNIMRVVVVEMTSGKTPPRVAIDEAIEIAREFGGADSPRFVNGVLDAVMKKLEGFI